MSDEKTSKDSAKSCPKCGHLWKAASNEPWPPCDDARHTQTDNNLLKAAKAVLDMFEPANKHSPVPLLWLDDAVREAGKAAPAVTQEKPWQDLLNAAKLLRLLLQPGEDGWQLTGARKFRDSAGFALRSAVDALEEHVSRPDNQKGDKA